MIMAHGLRVTMPYNNVVMKSQCYMMLQCYHGHICMFSAIDMYTCISVYIYMSYKIPNHGPVKIYVPLCTIIMWSDTLMLHITSTIFHLCTYAVSLHAH